MIGGKNTKPRFFFPRYTAIALVYPIILSYAYLPRHPVLLLTLRRPKSAPSAKSCKGMPAACHMRPKSGSTEGRGGRRTDASAKA